MKEECCSARFATLGGITQMEVSIHCADALSIAVKKTTYTVSKSKKRSSGYRFAQAIVSRIRTQYRRVR